MQVAVKHINRCSNLSIMKKDKLTLRCHLILSYLQKLKIWENRLWGNRHPYILLIVICIGAILMNKNLAITIKITENFDTTIQHMTYFSDMLPEVKKWYRCTHLFIAAYCLIAKAYLCNIKICINMRHIKWWYEDLNNCFYFHRYTTSLTSVMYIIIIYKI